MAWLKIDDGWYMHPKVRAAGLFGRALWIQAADWCAQQENDGFVPAFMLGPLVSLAEFPAEEAHNTMQRLVGLGLWVESTGEPGWVFHDWHVYQPARKELLARRKRDRRKKQLHSKDMEPIRVAARERDGDACRYCGIDVVFAGTGSRSGPYAATFDHVDPAGSNDLDNIVVACLSCNSRKKDRTPGEVGMTLRPVPGAAPAPSPPSPPRPPKRAVPARHATTPPAAPPRAPRGTKAPPSAAPRRAAARKATGPPR